MRGVCILMSWVTQGHLQYLEYLEYLLLVLLARDARHDALDHGRRHCPPGSGRDRGRLAVLIGLSYRGDSTYPCYFL
jgi:hypothetical protein